MKNTVVRLLESRHATRAILPEKLPEEVVGELVEAARLCPSCFNHQPWRFLFLESPEALEKGHRVLAPGNALWATRAPLLVIGYSRKEEDCAMPDGRLYHQFDLGMSALCLMLAATDRDLVARPMAGFDPAKVRAEFGLEPADEPLVVIAVGRFSEDDSHVPEYARGAEGKPRERKPAVEIIQRL